MSLAEIKEAVAALSADERNQLRDMLDALEEGVSVEELHAIDHALDEALISKEPSILAEKVWAEVDKLLESLGPAHPQEGLVPEGQAESSPAIYRRVAGK